PNDVWGEPVGKAVRITDAQSVDPFENDLEVVLSGVVSLHARSPSHSGPSQGQCVCAAAHVPRHLSVAAKDAPHGAAGCRVVASNRRASVRERPLATVSQALESHSTHRGARSRDPALLGADVEVGSLQSLAVHPGGLLCGSVVLRRTLWIGALALVASASAASSNGVALPGGQGDAMA